MPAPTLVILDCDGVLVDSERITTALLAEVATEAGWALSPADAIALFKGRDLHEVQLAIEHRISRPLGDRFIPDYRERMARAFEVRGVPPLAGATDLLDWLDDRSIAHAIASNGPQEKMRLTLGRIRPAIDARTAARRECPPEDWYARFMGRCFSAYDVGCWKPDPGLFLHAASAMGAPAREAVVVEDSCTGVVAAVAAGMRVIALADLTPREELSAAGATVTCASLEEVRGILADWAA